MDEKTLSLPSAAGMEKRIEELQRMATRDALSGLMNRDTLERCIKERLAAMTAEETCALFIVDLDDRLAIRPSAGQARSSPVCSGPATLWAGWAATSSQCSSAAVSRKSWCAARPRPSARNCSWRWGTAARSISQPA